MAKMVADAVLDASLDYTKNNTVGTSVCSAQPTTTAQATASYCLAKDVTLVSGDFTGPANGDSSGRKVTVNEQASIPVTVTGSANHVSLFSASAILYVTTCTEQVVTSGNTVTIPAWDIEIGDPT